MLEPETKEMLGEGKGEEMDEGQSHGRGFAAMPRKRVQQIAKKAAKAKKGKKVAAVRIHSWDDNASVILLRCC